MITGKTKHAHLNVLRKSKDHLGSQHIYRKNNLSILNFNKSRSIGGRQGTPEITGLTPCSMQLQVDQVDKDMEL